MPDKQPIGESLLGHAQWTKRLQFTLSLNHPHSLKNILHTLNALYITSVPDVERANVKTALWCPYAVPAALSTAYQEDGICTSLQY